MENEYKKLVEQGVIENTPMNWHIWKRSWRMAQLDYKCQCLDRQRTVELHCCSDCLKPIL